MQSGIIHWASMADAQSMLTNHLFYKAISERQSERPRPFPTRSELKWVNCVPTGFSKSCFARKNHRYSKNSCIYHSSWDKIVRFEMLWGYVLRNSNVKLKRTIVSDLVDVHVSRIFFKCFLICAILPFSPHYNPFPTAVNSLLLLLLLTLLHIPYIFQIALQASSHRALMDQILHNKNQSTNTAFWSWRSYCSPLTMLGQDFLCQS